MIFKFIIHQKIKVYIYFKILIQVLDHKNILYSSIFAADILTHLIKDIDTIKISL